MFDFGEKIWLQSYFRPVMQAAKPAGPDGIRRARPHVRGVHEGPEAIQV